MKTMTIRNVPDDLHEALTEERVRRGRSLNQTVIELLRQRLGLGTPRSNGLARLAGGWTDADYWEFEDALGALERVDEEIWR